MELSRDQMRRALRDAQAEQDAALADATTVLSAVFEGDSRLTARAKADALLGGLARRRFLRLGGFSVAAAAVIAACGESAPPSPNVPVAGEAPTTTGLPERTVDDSVLLRTASSLEYNAVEAYDAAIGLGVLSGPAADAAKLFREHHRQHAIAIESATRSIGGTAYSQANPVVKKNVIEPALALIAEAGNKAEDVLWFAYGLESVAAATYQTLVPALHTQNLRLAAARVASIESRHVVVLAAALKAPVSPVVAAAAATTSAGPTTTAATVTVEPPSISQIPSAFSPLGSTEIILGQRKLSLDALGPNSFMYNEAKKDTPGY
jgi:hypothetical protein